MEELAAGVSKERPAPSLVHQVGGRDMEQK